MKKYRVGDCMCGIGAALTFVVVFGPIAGAQEGTPRGDLSQVVSQLQATYEKVNDLQADFTQTVQFKDFDTPYVSKGKLFLKKGKMRWDYRAPSRQQIFVEGERVLYYVPEHQQVIQSRIGSESGSHLPLQLLMGTSRLDQHFQISQEKISQAPQKEVSLRLVPKERSTSLTRIVATVVPAPSIERPEAERPIERREAERPIDGWIIQKVVLYEDNGNVSTFSFEGIRINRDLPEELFNFKIPKGVEVIESP